jgi:hypothetical protein
VCQLKTHLPFRNTYLFFFYTSVVVSFELELLIFVFRARYFRLWFAWSLTRFNHPSGSRQLRFLLQNTAPFRLGRPEKHRYHADSNCVFADFVVTNQPLFGYRHRRIKIKTGCGWSKFPSDQLDNHQLHS